MNSLSVVIPCWSGTDALAEMAFNLAKQVKSMCDELIITEDAWQPVSYSKELESIADKYLANHGRLGHGQNLRYGFERATKNFVACIDSDIHIEAGTLRDLCIPGKLVYPTWADWQEYHIKLTKQEIWLIESPQWFVVGPKEFFLDCPPRGKDNGLEGLDQWGDEIRIRFPILHSEKLIYKHAGKTSYGVAKLPS